MSMFRVSGQGSSVALGGVRCEVDLDCKSPELSTGPVPWTSGKIASSAAGSLGCDPFRGVCVMKEKYEIVDDWWEGVV